MGDIIELTSRELEVIGSIQYLVTQKYIGKPKDIRVMKSLMDELKSRCLDAGFIVETGFESDGRGNLLPVCSIVGRVEPVEFDPERILHDHEEKKDA